MPPRPAPPARTPPAASRAAPRAALTIELTRRADGAVLRGVRADGSTTWQRQASAGTAFFAFHDLTHYAVECAVGAREGFFGLLAAGWDVADTDGKGPRGPLPPEALAVERLVGLLDVERAGGATWAAADFAAQLAAHGDAPPWLATLDDARLARIRADVQALHARWRALPVGGTLALPFPAPGDG